jgi:hypothetical protein
VTGQEPEIRAGSRPPGPETAEESVARLIGQPLTEAQRRVLRKVVRGTAEKMEEQAREVREVLMQGWAELGFTQFELERPPRAPSPFQGLSAELEIIDETLAGPELLGE